MITVQSLTRTDVRKFRAGLKKLVEFAAELDGAPHRRRRRRKAARAKAKSKPRAQQKPKLAASKPAKTKRSLQTVPDA